MRVKQKENVMDAGQLTLFGSNALHITLYDMSGAPLHPEVVQELIDKAEQVSKRESQLAISIVKD